MADMKISELSSVASLNNGDLIEVSQVDSSSPTGYTSMKASMKDVGDKVVNEIQYTQELDTSAKKITGAINENKSQIGDLSTLTTTVKSSLVGAVNEVDKKADSFIYTDSTVTDFITLFASIPNNKTVGFLMNSGTVSNCPVPYPTGVIAKWNSNTAFIELTQLNGTDASYIGRIISGTLTWRKITTTA